MTSSRVSQFLISAAWLTVPLACLDRPIWLVAGFVLGYLGLGLGIAAAFGQR
jgi:hypothetical protein